MVEGRVVCVGVCVLAGSPRDHLLLTHVCPAVSILQLRVS